MTRIELTNENGKYIVEHEDDEASVEFMMDMFESVLRAATYSQESIDRYMGRSKDEH
jgi:hypothetical protein